MPTIIKITITTTTTHLCACARACERRKDICRLKELAFGYYCHGCHINVRERETGDVLTPQQNTLEAPSIRKGKKQRCFGGSTELIFMTTGFWSQLYPNFPV